MQISAIKYVFLFEHFVCFRDLLHDLEKCNADPVAIADCFVSKVTTAASLLMFSLVGAFYLNEVFLHYCTSSTVCRTV